jgi:hypothetical protein
MKLQIPGVGDTLKLTKPWTFTIIPEHRNVGMYEFFFPETNWKHLIEKWEWDRFDWIGGVYRRNSKVVDPGKKTITLNPGVELVVDRMYMAKINTNHYHGNKDVKDFHSITFVIRKGCPILENKKQIRFFVSLADANTIDYKVAEVDSKSGLQPKP